MGRRRREATLRLRVALLYSRRPGTAAHEETASMATPQKSTDLIPDEERAADGRADAIASVLLVAIGVCTMVYFLAGQ